ncbi:hypothetical protein CRG98_044981 [Punica granatum]|uniref:Uncharacterized protein n=1 Tax=Punica granatum TaxID=22663 RepID=A0A2I0HSE1_PUNGR|nr:hypothetical protein CRG98_044981 [Punica granatum]
MQKSKLARVSRPGKVARKVSSRGLADPARLQEKLADSARLPEARARWLGEPAVKESNLAWISRPGKDAKK